MADIEWWDITMPNGDVWQSPGKTREDAYRNFESKIAGQLREEHLAKPFGERLAAAPDAFARIMSNSFLGVGDRLASIMPGGNSLEVEKQLTQEARARSGETGATALDLAGTIATAPLLPSGVDKFGKWFGGPKDVQFLSRLLAAGAENAGYGATEAAMQGNDVGSGAAMGGLFGMGGHTVAKAIGAVPAAAKYVDDLLGGVLSKGGKKAGGAIRRVPTSAYPESMRPFKPKVGIRIRGRDVDQPPASDAPIEAIRPPITPPPANPPAGPLAAPAAPPVAATPPVAPVITPPPMAPVVPAGPLAAEKVGIRAPKGLATAKTALIKTEGAIERAKKEMRGIPKSNAAGKKTVQLRLKTLEDLAEKQRAKISSFGAAKVAEDTALESVGAATPPVAPAGPLAAESMIDPMAEIKQRSAEIQTALASGKTPSGSKLTTAERAALGKEMTTLRDKAAALATEESAKAVVDTQAAPPGVLAQTAPDVATLTAAHDQAKAAVANQMRKLQDLANKGAPSTAQSFAHDKLIELNKAALSAKKALDAAQGTPEPIVSATTTGATEGPAIVPRKAAAGVLSSEKVLPEPKTPPKGKPGTKPISTNAPNFEAAKGPKGSSKQERAKAREKKAGPTPQELRAFAVQEVDRAISRARVHASGANSAGIDKALSTQLGDLLNNEKITAHLTPDELKAIQRTISGDPAVKSGRFVGHLASLPSVISSGGLATAPLLYGLNPLIGAASFPGIPAMGMYGRSVARRGAENLLGKVTDLTHGRTPPAPSGMDPNTVNDIYKVLRMLGTR